mmetsp:Transcript_39724/g.77206  ORF Transcript_39724/g.77206 Transcript_39724/m.77206 type:complete len:123 (-) Transcript_39724:268-636(-)
MVVDTEENAESLLIYLLTILSIEDMRAPLFTSHYAKRFSRLLRAGVIQFRKAKNSATDKNKNENKSSASASQSRLLGLCSILDDTASSFPRDDAHHHHHHHRHHRHHHHQSDDPCHHGCSEN